MNVTGGLGHDFLHPPPRSSGIHVSNVIRDIDNRLIHRGERPLDRELSEHEKRRMGNYREAGFIWELVYQEYFLLRSRLRFGLEQAELEKDGLFGTIDFVRFVEPRRWRVVDTKWTSMSSRRLQNFWTDLRTWGMQLMAYCMMVGTTHGALIVFFSNGDYAESGPQAFEVFFEFTERQLHMNWDMLVRHAKSMRKLNG